MRIRYTARARSDLESIFASIDQHSPSSAARVAQVIERSVAGLTDFPDIGPESGLGTRVLLVARLPYRVFYRVRGDEIDILHIRHTSRRPWHKANE